MNKETFKLALKTEYNKITIEYPDENWFNFEEILKGPGGFFIMRVLKKVLEKHIEHPTKPGYKRHDIIETLKTLESYEISTTKL